MKNIITATVLAITLIPLFAQAQTATSVLDRVRALTLSSGSREVLSRRLDAMARELALTPPGALLRNTGPALGLPEGPVEVVARALDQAVAAAPARPLRLAEARERLEALAPQVQDLAGRVGGVARDGGPARQDGSLWLILALELGNGIRENF